MPPRCDGDSGPECDHSVSCGPCMPTFIVSAASTAVIASAPSPVSPAPCAIRPSASSGVSRSARTRVQGRVRATLGITIVGDSGAGAVRRRHRPERRPQVSGRRPGMARSRRVPVSRPS